MTFGRVSRDQDTIIGVENVSVLFRLPHERFGTFKEYAIRRVQGRVSYTEFWALRDIHLTVAKGEVFAIIGRNGAGKTTLLKVVARILRPTTGRVWVAGSVAPLLGITAGLHPELTGRENIFLNGTLLGFSMKEMEEKFHRIVEFAELSDFIDAPLRTYSSGMMVRLGFAIATDSRPDILIVDEVMAVGDEAFQYKTSERMKQFSEEGSTILMVTHEMSMVEKMCERSAWIDQGRVMSYGPAQEVVRAYLDSCRVR